MSTYDYIRHPNSSFYVDGDAVQQEMYDRINMIANRHLSGPDDERNGRRRAQLNVIASAVRYDVNVASSLYVEIVGEWDAEERKRLLDAARRR